MFQPATLVYRSVSIYDFPPNPGVAPKGFPSSLITYGWWTKSSTTKDDDPIVYRVLTIPCAGFPPSTVWLKSSTLHCFDFLASRWKPQSLDKKSPQMMDHWISLSQMLEGNCSCPTSWWFRFAGKTIYIVLHIHVHYQIYQAIPCQYYSSWWLQPM